MSVTKSISNTLFRILPLMDSSTTTTTTTTAATATTTGNANAGSDGNNRSTVETHDDNDNDDEATSLSTDSSCSSCVSSCPSFVNEKEPLGPYRLVKTLGIGEFGKIKLGIHTETAQKVAIKVIKKNTEDANLAKVEREIQVLKSLRHPHIVKLIEVIETDTRIGIILEYASGGELFEYVLSHSSLEEDIARNLFAQLISSVNHMHRKGIVHRDLKLENLLFLDTQQTHIIVSDFGFANIDTQNKDLLSTCCGSPTYAAPELVYPSGGYKGPAADVWSCGVILYCMVCGYLPFDDDPENPESANLHQLYQYIRATTTSLSFPDCVSEDAQDLIRNMLQHNPAERCSVEAIINHPWLQVYRSTLFDMSTEQLEQQALDSIKNYHSEISASSAAAAASVDGYHQAKSKGHHRHHNHNQLQAIQENQQHHEDEDDDADNELTTQPYKFLELNDHADDNSDSSSHVGDIDQVQHYNIYDQTHNGHNIVQTQTTDDAAGPEMNYAPLLELTQVSDSAQQDQQPSKLLQNGDGQQDLTPPRNQQDHGVPEQKQDKAPEVLESKENHQQLPESSQPDQPLQENTSQSLVIPGNEQQELTPTENKLKIPEQRVNGLEELPQTANGSEELVPIKTQHHEVTLQKPQQQQHQELPQNGQHPQNVTQENQHKGSDQCIRQNETELAEKTGQVSQESTQSDNGDQTLDEQETQDHKENLDGATSQHHISDQREMKHQNHDSTEKEVEAMQVYSEQPPQHPMDTRSPITTISNDKWTNAVAKTMSSLSSHTNDKDLLVLPPLPPIPNGEESILHDSGIKEQQRQRQPSLRRQKKFRPSLTDDEPINTTITTTSAKNAVKTADQSKHDEDSSDFIGIRPSLLGKDSSTRYYSAMVQSDANARDQVSNNHVSDSDDGGHNDDDDSKNYSGGKVQNLKTTSLPLLNHPSNTMGPAIDANTSTTNLNDAIQKYNKGVSVPTSPGKRHKRFSSILSLNHAGPRPQRSQSTHLPKKSDFKIQDKEKESSSSPTTTTTSTSTTKLPVARKRTVTQTVKAWIHNKKKPFSKQHHYHRSSNSSLSESSSSGEFDGHEHPPVGAQQQRQHDDDAQQKRRSQQQQQIQQYRTASSPSSSVETPTTVDQQSGMRTLPHAQGENLTSMAPGHLILALVRMLTALGIDVKHDSSYQLTCLRKSCHHQKHHSFSSKKRNSKPFTSLTAPIYGPPELDHGHHVAFSVEICRSLLSDLHVIDIQLKEGDVLAFEFLRSKLLALLNLNV